MYAFYFYTDSTHLKFSSDNIVCICQYIMVNHLTFLKKQIFLDVARLLFLFQGKFSFLLSLCLSICQFICVSRNFIALQIKMFLGILTSHGVKYMKYVLVIADSG